MKLYWLYKYYYNYYYSITNTKCEYIISNEFNYCNLYLMHIN